MNIIKASLLTALAVATAIAFAIATSWAQPQPPQPPIEIWLIVDGNAIGTVEPGTFEYDRAANTVSVDTNELVYGCSQDRLFKDRFTRP